MDLDLCATLLVMTRVFSVDGLYCMWRTLLGRVMEMLKRLREIPIARKGLWGEGEAARKDGSVRSGIRIPGASWTDGGHIEISSSGATRRPALHFVRGL